MRIKVEARPCGRAPVALGKWVLVVRNAVGSEIAVVAFRTLLEQPVVANLDVAIYGAVVPPLQLEHDAVLVARRIVGRSPRSAREAVPLVRGDGVIRRGRLVRARVVDEPLAAVDVVA